MNEILKSIAKHFYEVNYGNNWTDASVKDSLQNVSYEQAVKQIGKANTIALLLFHMDFYNNVVYNRIAGINRRFDHEESLQVNIADEAGWNTLQQSYFENVDRIHQAILAFDASLLFEEKTANTPYKNLHGMIEHLHYHLGQINLLKKLLQ